MSQVTITQLPNAQTLTGTESVPIVQNGVTVQATTAAIAQAGGAGSGTVTQVNTGTGLTGGPINTTGTISLANTGVTAGSYTNSNIIVDSQGRITSASNGSGGGGSGTVTNVSVVSANGLAGTVANATTTPAITLSTSVSGILKGNGTGISAATSGTDYAPATSGTSILYGDGSGGFSNVMIGTNLSFTSGTLNATGGGGMTYPAAGIANSTGSAWGTSYGTSGANSVALRDANQNISTNAFFAGFTSVAASGTQITLTAASTPVYYITGSGGQVIQLPNATTLPKGPIFSFNNNQSSGAITVNNNSGTLIVSVPSGGYTVVVLIDNSTAAGSWDHHDLTPSNVSWSTNTFDYPGSITSATWNGTTVALSRGGTGQTTAQAAMNSFAGAVTSGSYLRGNGTNVVMSTIQATDVPTLNQNTTGSAATLTTARGIYGNNFDGSAALTQIIASTYGGTGNGFTKFSGATSAEKTYTLPDATTTILTTNAAVTPSQGGTGQTTYTDGQLLIGNSTGNTLTKATLTAGTGITITNGGGSISIAASGGGSGTVTSVGGTGTVNGLTLTGTVTTSGNLTLGGTLDLSSPPAIGGTTASTGKFTTVTSTATTGTAPFTVASTTQVANLNAATAGSAATLTTSRSIYGSSFNGSADLSGVIASTYGGTGNGFTKFSGATSAEKTYTLPDATTTILTTNAAVTVGQGGTGQTSYIDGELLIGNSTGNTLTKTTLTAGAGVSITNGSGSISIASPLAKSISVFTSGTAQTYTAPANTQWVKVTVVGPGGNGAGASGARATGGGGGAVAIKGLAMTAGQTLTYTVGTTGTASTVSSGTLTISTITANSGSNGATTAYASSFTNGPAGGAATGGDVNITGGLGGNSYGSGTTVGINFSGKGGDCPGFGSGGAAIGCVANVGLSGQGYGAGAGGSHGTATTGSGKDGIIIFEAF